MGSWEQVNEITQNPRQKNGRRQNSCGGKPEPRRGETQETCYVKPKKPTGGEKTQATEEKQ